MTILAEIESYLRRTGMAQTLFSRMAMGDGAFVQRLRKSCSVRDRTVERCRAFMAEHPDGIPPKKKSSTKSGKTKQRELASKRAVNPHFNRAKRNSIDPDSLPRVYRTPCWNCGVRGDIGCEHQPKIQD